MRKRTGHRPRRICSSRDAGRATVAFTAYVHYTPHMDFDFLHDPQDEHAGSLPAPNVRMKMSGSTSPFTEKEIRGILSNPLYAGVGPYPQLIPEEQWVRAAAKIIREEGPEQFLVNLLHL